MTPGDYPLAIYAGDYRKLPIIQLGDEITQQDESVVFEPKDLTGCTVQAQIRSRRGSATLKAAFVCTIQEPATDGKVLVELMASQSGNLTRDGVWDLQVVDADGRPETWLTGEVTVTRDVTST